MAPSQARIFEKDTGEWVISPLGETTNPTRLNGIELQERKRYPIREGDTIEVGKLRMKIEFER